MIDSLLRHRELAKRSPTLDKLGVRKNHSGCTPYGVLTLHRLRKPASMWATFILSFTCCKGRGDGRVHIPHDQDHLWPVVKQNWFDALHNFRSLHCVAAGTSFEIHIRFSAGLSPRRNCRREGRRSAVEVHQAVFDVVKVLQFFDDGSDFHEGWPCPNYAQKPNHRESPAVIRLRTIGSKGDWLKSMMEKY